MNTAELIERCPGVPDEDKALLLAACATKGKYSGFIAAKSTTGTVAAWSALVFHVTNGNRPSMGSLLMMRQADREVWQRLSDIIQAHVFLRYGLHATEPEFRWSIWALNNDPDAYIEAIEKALMEVAQ
jgi:hypothetical protein